MLNTLHDFVANPLWLLFLTVASLWAGNQIRRHANTPFANPLLISAIFLIAYLKLLNIDFATYNQTAQYLTFWLQPAVVCLAVPLYLQWQKIRKQWRAILIAEVVGSMVGIVSGVEIAKLFGASERMQLSIAAKSVTMPIALDVTQSVGGIPALVILAVMTAGISGQVMGLLWLRWVQVKTPSSTGLAVGTASHALGIIAALEASPRLAAYATVGLILNGVLTAIFAPLLLPLLV